MTDINTSDLVVQTVYAQSDPYLRAADIVVLTLRSTDASGDTFIVCDDMVVLTLRSTAEATAAGGSQRAMVLA